MEMLRVLLVAFLAEWKVVADCAVKTVVSCGDSFVAFVASEPSVESLRLLVLFNLLFQRFAKFIFIFNSLFILLLIVNLLIVLNLVSVLIGWVIWVLLEVSNVPNFIIEELHIDLFVLSQSFIVVWSIVVFIVKKGFHSLVVEIRDELCLNSFSALSRSLLSFRIPPAVP